MSSAWQWVAIPWAPRHHDAKRCPRCGSDSSSSSEEPPGVPERGVWRLRKSGPEWAEPRHLTQVCGRELRATSAGVFRSRAIPVSVETWNVLGVPAWSLSAQRKPSPRPVPARGLRSSFRPPEGSVSPHAGAGPGGYAGDPACFCACQRRSKNCEPTLKLVSH